MPSVKYELWSVKCGDCSVEFGVRGMDCSVSSKKILDMCRVWNRMGSVECGV